jgi:2-desacetyl-2-hydroxyethyl bacteriochlorophyllide A dehydrogenase
MKAVVIERPHDASWRDIEQPACGPEDVLVKSHAAGLCRTDLEILGGEVPEQWVRYPCIPGHEWSGRIAEVGEAVTDLQIGDRVVSEGFVPCNACTACKLGTTNLCANFDQVGFTRGGGYGEYVVVPRRVVHLLPAHVSLDAAVLVEPASCVYRALQSAAPEPGETLGVFGIGTLGSLALKLARLFAPGLLIAFGVRRDELQLARDLGADRVVDVSGADPEEAVLDLARGGLDVVIETAGSPVAVENATRVARPGGRVALLGLAGASHTLELPSDRFVVNDLKVIGSLSYTAAVWTKVMRLLDHRLVDFESLVTHRFPMADFEEAFSFMDRREGVVVKVLLHHEPN